MMIRESAVASVAALAEPGAIEFTVGDGDWPFRGFVVKIQGNVFAYANVCPHQRHPLNLTPDGFFTPDKSALLCTSHGAVFVPDTGACIGGPCTGKYLQKLACRIIGDTVYVTSPDSLRAE